MLYAGHAVADVLGCHLEGVGVWGCVRCVRVWVERLPCWNEKLVGGREVFHMPMLTRKQLTIQGLSCGEIAYYCTVNISTIMATPSTEKKRKRHSEKDERPKKKKAVVNGDTAQPQAIPNDSESRPEKSIKLIHLPREEHDIPVLGTEPT